jgi:hypothetical protein
LAQDGHNRNRRALTVIDGNEPAERQVGGRRLDENLAALTGYQDGPAAARAARLASDLPCEKGLREEFAQKV